MTLKGITTLATQWTHNNIQPDGQQGHASLNHDSVVGDQADKIESLEHLIHALISSKDERAGTKVDTTAKGLTTKDFVSWSTGHTDKDRD